MSYVWYLVIFVNKNNILVKSMGGYYFNLYISFYILTKNRRRKSNFWKVKGAMTPLPSPLILKLRDIARSCIN